MKAITYHVPAFDYDEAREIAYAVHAGRMGHTEHYLDAAAAQRVCDHLNRLSTKHRGIFTVEVDERVTHDGVIPVAWTVDQIGDVAAILVIFALIPLVGLASLWEKIA
jgi:hypothetical protein